MQYEGWDKDYLENKELYQNLFDKVMQEDNEQSVEFLEKKIAKYVGRKHGITCNSATDALYYSLLCYDIGYGDEVLVSDFSWISSASCIKMAGATPVFCDIDIDSYHISFEEIQKKTTKRTKALIYTHLFGNMVDTKEIETFCKNNDIIFIEDAAQSLGSIYHSRYAGSIGDISSFSFNHNKVISGISGGGIVLTDDDNIATYVRKLKQHGKNKDEYELLGYNSKMLYINAAFIEMRFDRIEELQLKRNKIAYKYHEALEDIDVIRQVPHLGHNHNYHKYVVMFNDKETRDRVKDELDAQVKYDRPLSGNSMFEKVNNPNAQLVADTILSLPIHPYVTEEEVLKTAMVIGIMA